MKKKLVGTYTIQDFPPASLEELHANLAIPVLGAINQGAAPTSPASIPLANVCSMLHTLGLMHDRISAIYSLIYEAEAEKALHSYLDAQAELVPMFQVIWEDYQKYKITRQEGEKKMEEHLRKLEEAEKRADKGETTDADVDLFIEEFGELLETDRDM